MNYSPIIIFVYNRADHFLETYNALIQCSEAKHSDLYIFSDGPKNDSAVAGVNETRKCIHAIEHNSDFNSVTIVEANNNLGLAASVISGVTQIIEKYGRAIIIEDDCVASSYLLNYMNTCLDVFSNDFSVGAIAGYTPQISFPDDYSDDIFTAYRSCSCCWATWADRWENVDWELNSINDFYENTSLIKKLNSNGADRFIRLYRQSKGKGQSWSVRFGAHLVKQNWLTVYPRFSYIKNIGCDETGIHSTVKDAKQMQTDLAKSIPNPVIKPVKLDYRIQKILKKHYSAGIASDIKRFVGTKFIIFKERIR